MAFAYFLRVVCCKIDAAKVRRSESGGRGLSFFDRFYPFFGARREKYVVRATADLRHGAPGCSRWASGLEQAVEFYLQVKC